MISVSVWEEKGKGETGWRCCKEGSVAFGVQGSESAFVIGRSCKYVYNTKHLPKSARAGRRTSQRLAMLASGIRNNIRVAVSKACVGGGRLNNPVVSLISSRGVEGGSVPCMSGQVRRVFCLAGLGFLSIGSVTVGRIGAKSEVAAPADCLSNPFGKMPTIGWNGGRLALQSGTFFWQLSRWPGVGQVMRERLWMLG